MVQRRMLPVTTFRMGWHWPQPQRYRSRVCRVWWAMPIPHPPCSLTHRKWHRGMPLLSAGGSRSRLQHRMLAIHTARMLPRRARGRLSLRIGSLPRLGGQAIHITSLHSCHFALGCNTPVICMPSLLVMYSGVGRCNFCCLAERMSPVNADS